ncbi:MAG: thiamine-phosphate kinase [Myxococcales bacterium]|nr:thiamine-phosphate kinase [Myxococcales bacterium]
MGRSDKPPSTRGEPTPPEPISEAALIARIGRALARAGLPVALDDDCAHLTDATALVTTDTLVESVHFDRALDSLEAIGAQAAVVNLSDLAASGGAAGWLVWSLCLPPSWTPPMVEALADGFATVAARHGARVVGGNLSRITGPAVIAVTAGGPLVGDRPLTRRGALPGDALYVTGPLGDAALGYVQADAETRAARHRWRPHLAEAAALVRWGHVHAAMDVSDGLLLDTARLCAVSGVGADINSTAVPVSALYRARLGDDRRLAISGGEDYVLLFAAPADLTPPTPAHRVGRCTAAPGLRVDGQPHAPRGHDHFAAGMSA